MAEFAQRRRQSGQESTKRPRGKGCAAKTKLIAEIEKGNDVRLLPLGRFQKASGSAIFDAMHEAQARHPLHEVWDSSFKLPETLVEYVSAICADEEPEVRQEAVLLFKRYVWGCSQSRRHTQSPPPQVVALTCGHLAAKHWQSQRLQHQRKQQSALLSEQGLHVLSRNSYTRQDFINAEEVVMSKLRCVVHWEATLISEWVGVVIILAKPLLSQVADVSKLRAVAAHVSDVLAFCDTLMANYLPSELAAATLHASTMLCTRRFQRHAFTLRVGHLCRIAEEQMVQLSEEILQEVVGRRRAEFLLEGSGLTADASDLNSGDRHREASVSVKRSKVVKATTKRSSSYRQRTSTHE